MRSRKVTVTIPAGIYEQVQALVEKGFFGDFDEAVSDGLRHVLLEVSFIRTGGGLLPSLGPERYRYFLNRLRQEIKEAGGLFPDNTRDEVIERLRRTREQLYEEEFAPHLGL